MFKLQRTGWLAVAGVLTAFGSSGPWNKDAAQWTSADAQRILTASPWVQLAGVKFDNPSEEEMQAGETARGANTPPPANMGPNGGTDGKWDGGVGRMPRGGKPTLSVTLQWESAKPVEEALAKSGQVGQPPAQNSNDYVIAVSGLIPATPAHKDENADDAHPEGDGRQRLLENLMSASRLYPKGHKAIAPENAVVDASTGTLRLYFPRTEAITLKDKEVDFVTRYGAMSVRGVFHLKEMCVQGQLAL